MSIYCLHDGFNEGQRSIVDGEYTKMTHEFHRRPFIYRQDFKAAKQAAPQENKWTPPHLLLADNSSRNRTRSSLPSRHINTSFWIFFRKWKPWFYISGFVIPRNMCRQRQSFFTVLRCGVRIADAMEFLFQVIPSLSRAEGGYLGYLGLTGPNRRPSVIVDRILQVSFKLSN